MSDEMYFMPIIARADDFIPISRQPGFVDVVGGVNVDVSASLFREFQEPTRRPIRDCSTWNFGPPALKEGVKIPLDGMEIHSMPPGICESEENPVFGD